MRSQGQLIAGIAIILIGLVILFGNIFNINLWGICWPTALILLGLWLLLRPRMVSPGTHVSFVLIGDVNRDGAWEVIDEEFWMLVGDIDLDLTQAQVPVGETRLRVVKFVGDLEVLVPADVAVALDVHAFVSNVKAFGERSENFLAPVHLTSDGYAAAERRVRLDVLWFAGEVKIRHV